MKCPWHNEWHLALDKLEFSGKHPWQLKPAWQAAKRGMSRSDEVPIPWYVEVDPAESAVREALRTSWDKAASWWVSRYTSRGDINREWIVDPVLFNWLGGVKGKRILDAGCGEGYLSRLLAERGAKMDGVDLSAELLAVARRKEESGKLGVHYRRGDLSDLSFFPDGCFDVCVSNMVLMDVARYREAVREVFRVLKEGGRFLLSLTHPAFEAPPARWLREPRDSFRIEDRRFLAVDRYFDRLAVFWGPPDGRVVIGGFHRPLRDYFEALSGAGFLVSRFEEPYPSKEALRKHFYYFADLTRVPLFLLIEAVRPQPVSG